MAGSNQWVLGEGSDNQFAWLENDEGHNVVCIERLAGNVAERVTFAGPAVTNFRESEILKHATTDSQWQAITDCIAAAPEMLAACKEMVRAFERGDEADKLVALRLIKDAIAKAEPPRKVKKRMLVTVEVEVEADSGTTLDVFKRRAAESVYTSAPVDVVYKGKEVTERYPF